MGDSREWVHPQSHWAQLQWVPLLTLWWLHLANSCTNAWSKNLSLLFHFPFPTLHLLPYLHSPDTTSVLMQRESRGNNCIVYMGKHGALYAKYMSGANNKHLREKSKWQMQYVTVIYYSTVDSSHCSYTCESVPFTLSSVDWGFVDSWWLSS